MESRCDNLELAVLVPCLSSQKMRRRQRHPLLRSRLLGTLLRQSRRPLQGRSNLIAETLQKPCNVERIDRPACMIRNSTMLEKFFCGVQDVHIQAILDCGKEPVSDQKASLAEPGRIRLLEQKQAHSCGTLRSFVPHPNARTNKHAEAPRFLEVHTAGEDMAATQSLA